VRLSTLAVIVCSSVLGVARAEVISYTGDVLPEEAGFEHEFVYDPARWVSGGWFFEEIDQGGGSGGPYDGDFDTQRFSLGSFAGSPFFIEWRMLTDAPDSEVDLHNGGAFLILAGGAGVTYHFNIASGLARILRGYPYPTLYFAIEPGVPHTYLLEVYGSDYFEFRIDGVLMDPGLPEGLYPVPGSYFVFGARYYLSPHTSQWDYVRFGTIPEPGTGVLLLAGAGWLMGSQRQVRRQARPGGRHGEPSPDR